MVPMVSSPDHFCSIGPGFIVSKPDSWTHLEVRRSGGESAEASGRAPRWVPSSPGGSAFWQKPPRPGLRRPDGCPGHTAGAGTATAVADPRGLRTSSAADEVIEKKQ
ncbi:Mitogen-Activated Protein Kinase Kinase Kinase 5 [Manis pentadactyla]|nr:Mitogen-Activated Protein Kinase Kinase Kinase 5 [Manis pentadactyla]